MNAEIKKSVFESFSQMRLDHKRQFGGIGLGLTIVNHLVALFNGSLTLESREGKGTELFIDLSLKVVLELRQGHEISKKEEELPQIHILVVEDNLMNQMVMKKVLARSLNISFTIVDNGEKAIAALKAMTYDMILMDLQMPIMDGYEATKIIRSGILGHRIEHIPIIAVTADAMQETRQRVLEIGMNDYMTKPITKDILMEKIYHQSDIKLRIA